MKVYVTMLEDRHVDVDVFLFTTQIPALLKAQELLDKYNRGGEIKAEKPDEEFASHIWYYGSEGDLVRVMEKEVIGI
ncbi:hypothetical protein HN682_06125 [Candidatus Peregrinibacteria bacterium]|jgi:hypothetical protein|nr:hypothetical protein [Candidatus Peregrinibacteria bacterium]